MISGVRANDYSENACAQYIFPKTAQDSISASVVASTKPIPMAATASAVAQHELNSTQLSCGCGRGRYSALRLGNSRLATGNWQLCLACAAKWKWKCTAIYAKSQRKRGVEKEGEKLKNPSCLWRRHLDTFGSVERALGVPLNKLGKSSESSLSPKSARATAGSQWRRGAGQ